ncbi:MAG: CcmD family protein [Capsulimonadaceae bacterium]
MNMVPLMIVPLMVWIAVWGYLWTLDRKVKRLEAELDNPEGDDAK